MLRFFCIFKNIKCEVRGCEVKAHFLFVVNIF